MDTRAKEVVRACTTDSDEERTGFAEIVARLIVAGVERYHADLVRAEKAYYMPDGSFEVVPSVRIDTAPAAEFSASGVAAAVRAVQAATIGYQTFCRQVMAAGCVGYHVSIAGRRVVYYGRTGDSHVEWFPGAR